MHIPPLNAPASLDTILSVLTPEPPEKEIVRVALQSIIESKPFPESTKFSPQLNKIRELATGPGAQEKIQKKIKELLPSFTPSSAVLKNAHSFLTTLLTQLSLTGGTSPSDRRLGQEVPKEKLGSEQLDVETLAPGDIIACRSGDPYGAYRFVTYMDTYPGQTHLMVFDNATSFYQEPAMVPISDCRPIMTSPERVAESVSKMRVLPSSQEGLVPLTITSTSDAPKISQAQARFQSLPPPQRALGDIADSSELIPLHEPLQSGALIAVQRSNDPPGMFRYVKYLGPDSHNPNKLLFYDDVRSTAQNPLSKDKNFFRSVLLPTEGVPQGAPSLSLFQKRTKKHPNDPNEKLRCPDRKMCLPWDRNQFANLIPGDRIALQLPRYLPGMYLTVEYVGPGKKSPNNIQWRPDRWSHVQEEAKDYFRIIRQIVSQSERFLLPEQPNVGGIIAIEQGAPLTSLSDDMLTSIIQHMDEETKGQLNLVSGRLHDLVFTTTISDCTQDIAALSTFFDKLLMIPRATLDQLALQAANYSITVPAGVPAKELYQKILSAIRVPTEENIQQCIQDLEKCDVQETSKTHKASLLQILQKIKQSIDHRKTFDLAFRSSLHASISTPQTFLQEIQKLQRTLIVALQKLSPEEFEKIRKVYYHRIEDFPFKNKQLRDALEPIFTIVTIENDKELLHWSDLPDILKRVLQHENDLGKAIMILNGLTRQDLRTKCLRNIAHDLDPREAIDFLNYLTSIEDRSIALRALVETYSETYEGEKVRDLTARVETGSVESKELYEKTKNLSFTLDSRALLLTSCMQQFLNSPDLSSAEAFADSLTDPIERSIAWVCVIQEDLRRTPFRMLRERADQKQYLKKVPNLSIRIQIEQLLQMSDESQDLPPSYDFMHEEARPGSPLTLSQIDMARSQQPFYRGEPCAVREPTGAYTYSIFEGYFSRQGKKMVQFYSQQGQLVTADLSLSNSICLQHINLSDCWWTSLQRGCRIVLNNDCKYDKYPSFGPGQEEMAYNDVVTIGHDLFFTEIQDQSHVFAPRRVFPLRKGDWVAAEARNQEDKYFLTRVKETHSTYVTCLSKDGTTTINVPKQEIERLQPWFLERNIFI